ncbi:MAG: class I SAM-dependent methyltransferase [Myxococcales bacterium]|nr:class I SAM-dependent methyltransferase [Polyangiaceae bacterium]MDW8250837.1 class I SAM-dependent methyltransferase [Myxococcales bacterium]
MLDQLAAKEALCSKVTLHHQDILSNPLEIQVDLVVSAIAMHHVEDAAALFRTLGAPLVNPTRWGDTTALFRTLGAPLRPDGCTALARST